MATTKQDNDEDHVGGGGCGVATTTRSTTAPNTRETDAPGPAITIYLPLQHVEAYLHEFVAQSSVFGVLDTNSGKLQSQACADSFTQCFEPSTESPIASNHYTYSLHCSASFWFNQFSIAVLRKGITMETIGGPVKCRTICDAEVSSAREPGPAVP